MTDDDSGADVFRPLGPPRRRRTPWVLLLIAGACFLILVAAGGVWLFDRVVNPPVTRTPQEAKAACQRAVTDEMDSPAKVTFGKETAKELRKGNWVVSGAAKSQLGDHHVMKAEFECTIAEGALTRPPAPHQDDWITITQQ